MFSKHTFIVRFNLFVIRFVFVLSSIRNVQKKSLNWDLLLRHFFFFFFFCLLVCLFVFFLSLSHAVSRLCLNSTNDQWWSFSQPQRQSETSGGKGLGGHPKRIKSSTQGINHDIKRTEITRLRNSFHNVSWWWKCLPRLHIRFDLPLILNLKQKKWQIFYIFPLILTFQQNSAQALLLLLLLQHDQSLISSCLFPKLK